MKVYVGYKAYAMQIGITVEHVFGSEEKAKSWSSEENSKEIQEFDDYGLISGREFNYFEMEVE